MTKTTVLPPPLRSPSTTYIAAKPSIWLSVSLQSTLVIVVTFAFTLQMVVWAYRMLGADVCQHNDDRLSMLPLASTSIPQLLMAIISLIAARRMTEARAEFGLAACHCCVKIACITTTYNCLAWYNNFRNQGECGMHHAQQYPFLSGWKWTLNAIIFEQLLFLLSDRSNRASEQATLIRYGAIQAAFLNVIGPFIQCALLQYIVIFLDMFGALSCCIGCAGLFVNVSRQCTFQSFMVTHELLWYLRFIPLLVLISYHFLGSFSSIEDSGTLGAVILDTTMIVIPSCLKLSLVYDALAIQSRKHEHITRFVRWLAHEVRVPAHNTLMALSEAREAVQFLLAKSRSAIGDSLLTADSRRRTSSHHRSQTARLHRGTNRRLDPMVQNSSATLQSDIRSNRIKHLSSAAMHLEKLEEMIAGGMTSVDEMRLVLDFASRSVGGDRINEENSRWDILRLARRQALLFEKLFAAKGTQMKFTIRISKDLPPSPPNFVWPATPADSRCFGTLPGFRRQRITGTKANSRHKGGRVFRFDTDACEYAFRRPRSTSLNESETIIPTPCSNQHSRHIDVLAEETIVPSHRRSFSGAVARGRNPTGTFPAVYVTGRKELLRSALRNMLHNAVTFGGRKVEATLDICLQENLKSSPVRRKSSVSSSTSDASETENFQGQSVQIQRRKALSMDETSSPDQHTEFNSQSPYLQSEVQPAHLTFTITDDGVGFTETESRNLFRPFARSHRNVRRDGLGLSICKAAADAYGGYIHAKSAGLNEGSEFVFRVPLEVRKIQPL